MANTKLILDMTGFPSWMSDEEIFSKLSLVPEISQQDDDFRGIKFFHPVGYEVVLARVDRNEVDELYAIFHVSEEQLQRYREEIERQFQVL